MHSDFPLVSVVMINYNGMPWLDIAARSVLASGNVAFELVIVDDCSQDDSREHIRQLAADDDRVKPVFLEQNQGISGARNAGIDAARGEFIAIIDSDDCFLPDTIERQLQTFQTLSVQQPGLTMLMSDAWLINEKGERVGRYISSDWWGRMTALDPPLWTLPSTFFFRREHAARFNPGYRSADGPIFVRRMEALGPLGFIGEPLIEYRLRTSSVTNLSGARMLREMNASELSRQLGRLDNPIPAEEIDAPDPRAVAAWIHGRNAKNAAANGHPFIAAREVLIAALAQPGVTCGKLLRALQTYGRRFAARSSVF
jgi:glycosyltransferase involved in cell wall biosynthesis